MCLKLGTTGTAAEARQGCTTDSDMNPPGSAIRPLSHCGAPLPPEVNTVANSCGSKRSCKGDGRQGANKLLSKWQGRWHGRTAVFLQAGGRAVGKALVHAQAVAATCGLVAYHSDSPWQAAAGSMLHLAAAPRAPLLPQLVRCRRPRRLPRQVCRSWQLHLGGLLQPWWRVRPRPEPSLATGTPGWPSGHSLQVQQQAGVHQLRGTSST